MRSHRRSPALLAVACAVLVLLTGGTPAAAGSFYDPPSPLPAGRNGDVLRSEPMTFYLDPLKTLPAPAQARRIMYRSTDTHGRPVAVTGTVLTPRVPWHGTGQRPLIGYAVGTQGVGDDCAPSKALAAGNEYEGPFLTGLLARGYGVVVTDYQGLGTPGMHTYVNRAAEGHAVLDAIRAAQRLRSAGLPAHGPVAIAGYSQGGGASAAAAELAPSYAPELHLKGAYAGAVPADLAPIASSLDGTYSAGLLGYALLGLNAAYPELKVYDKVNAHGRQVLDAIATECTAAVVLNHAFTRTRDLTRDGRPLSAYLAEQPYRARVAQQRIGERRPAVPMLVVHSVLDDIVPYPQDRDAARSWCRKGATVQFSSTLVPTHVGAAVRAFPEAFAWLEGRFAGRPAPDNCGRF